MRRFLFLQGNATPFYRMLGEALAREGAGVRRVNYCGGDRTFWRGWNAEDFRAPKDEHPAFLRQLVQREKISDIVMFSDCRPFHQDAVSVAESSGCRIWVFEEGYLRPQWVTLERCGVNGNSRLPRDAEWYREMAKGLPDREIRRGARGGLRERILYDIRWQITSYLAFFRYPHFRTHRPYPFWAEAATWAKRLSTLFWRRRQASSFISDLGVRKTQYVFLPLQLDSDYQIKVHSRFTGIPDFLETVLSSFASHAPADLHLVIKNHPLDNGWINYRRQVERQAKHLQVSRRVHFIDGGGLTELIHGARGVVTANSTVGLNAIDYGKPLTCLGEAIYDLPGLTFQGPLDEFWMTPMEVDKELAQAFIAVLIKMCLVNGNFYTSEGMSYAIEGSLTRLLADEDPLSLLSSSTL